MTKKTVRRSIVGIGMAVGSLIGLIEGVEAYLVADHNTKGMANNTEVFLNATATLLAPLIFLGSTLAGGAIALLGAKVCFFVKDKYKNDRDNDRDVERALLSSNERPVFYSTIKMDSSNS